MQNSFIRSVINGKLNADAVDGLAQTFLLIGVVLEPEHGLLQKREDFLLFHIAGQRCTHAGGLAPGSAYVYAVNGFAFICDSAKRALSGANAAALAKLGIYSELSAFNPCGL